ncbi:MAG: TetR/AcrR family transcriptional regulator [Acidimicrobiales bacterium]
MTPGENDPRVVRSRAAVMAATLELLADGGYAGLSIDAISKRSGVARTTIYRHWPSLAEIVTEAATSTVGIKAVPDTGDARADLRAHLDVLAEKMTRSDWGRMLPTIVDAASRDPELLELQRRTTAERRMAAMAIAAKGVANGQIRDDVDLDLVGEMLVGPIFTRHLVTHQPITEQFLDDLLDMAFRIIGTD